MLEPAAWAWACVCGRGRGTGRVGRPECRAASAIVLERRRMSSTGSKVDAFWAQLKAKTNTPPTGSALRAAPGALQQAAASAAPTTGNQRVTTTSSATSASPSQRDSQAPGADASLGPTSSDSQRPAWQESQDALRQHAARLVEGLKAESSSVRVKSCAALKARRAGAICVAGCVVCHAQSRAQSPPRTSCCRVGQRVQEVVTFLSHASGDTAAAVGSPEAEAGRAADLELLGELVETSMGKTLLRRFDDASQACRESAVATFLLALQVRPSHLGVGVAAQWAHLHQQCCIAGCPTPDCVPRGGWAQACPGSVLPLLPYAVPVLEERIIPRQRAVRRRLGHPPRSSLSQPQPGVRRLPPVQVTHTIICACGTRRWGQAPRPAGRPWGAPPSFPSPLRRCGWCWRGWCCCSSRWVRARWRRTPARWWRWWSSCWPTPSTTSMWWPARHWCSSTVRLVLPVGGFFGAMQGQRGWREGKGVACDPAMLSRAGGML